MFAIKNLSGSDLEVIRAHLEEKTYEKGSLLYEAAVQGHSMFFVETGSLKVVNRKSVDGSDDQIIAVVKPGGFCGEEVILNEGGIYGQTVVALEDSVVFELKSSALQKIMTDSTVAGSKLILGISKNYREAINMTEKVGKLIGFVSAKDGSGKTTVCMNMAEAISRRKHKVLVIDCDFQLGNAHMHVGRPASPNLSRLIQMEERLTYDRIKKFIIPVDGFHVLAAPELPQDSELITRSQVNQIINECARNYDFVLLDIASHIDEFSILLWDDSDMIVFVQTPDLANLTRFKRLMSAIKRLNYPNAKFLGVVNSYLPECADYFAQFKAILPIDWLTISEEKETVKKALFNGRSIIAEAPDSAMVMEIDKICERILTGKIADPKEKAGIFSWLKQFYAGE